MSGCVVRAFIRVRRLAFTHTDLAQKLQELEMKAAGDDGAIRQLVDAIRELMTPKEPPNRRQIGFTRRSGKVQESEGK